VVVLLRIWVGLDVFHVWVSYVFRSQLTQGVEVLVAGQIVADHVVGLPASEQGEARPDLHLH